MRRDPFEMLERCHRRLEETLEMLRTPTRQALDEARTRQVVARLGAAYAEPIAVEERELFPAARAALDADDLGGMASEMESRRGK